MSILLINVEAEGSFMFVCMICEQHFNSYLFINFPISVCFLIKKSWVRRIESNQGLMKKPCMQSICVQFSSLMHP